MKKLMIAILTIGMSLMFLTGCGGTPASTPASTPAPSPTTTPNPTAVPPVGNAQAPATNNQPANNQVAISADQAKAIALQHAGVAEANTWGLKVEQGIRNAQNVYEVDFKANGRDYDYDIDAVTGAIVKADIEIDD